MDFFPMFSAFYEYLFLDQLKPFAQTFTGQCAFKSWTFSRWNDKPETLSVSVSVSSAGFLVISPPATLCSQQSQEKLLLDYYDAC